MSQKKKTSLNALAAWALLLGGTFSWVQLLWPPVGKFLSKTPDATPFSVLADLLSFRSVIYEGYPLLGYIFLLVGIIPFVLLTLLGRTILNYIDNSNVPISVLETSINLSFEDDLMTRSMVRRDQLFHANRYVTAYKFTTELTGEHASFVPDGIFVESCIGQRKVTKEVLRYGSARKRELIEAFDGALPTRLWSTYLPNALILGLYNWLGAFKSVVVKRVAWTRSLHEYDGESAMLGLTSLMYPVTNVRVRIDFPQATAPLGDAISAVLISENIVEPIHLTPDARPNVIRYEVRLRSFKKVTLRVRWTNERLQAFRAAGGPVAAAPEPLAPPASAAWRRQRIWRDVWLALAMGFRRR